MAKRKRCHTCGITKPLTSFYVHRKMGDGRLGRCKECHKAAARERYHRKMADPEWRAAERVRSRSKWHVHGHKWKQALDPLKREAHIKVGNAVRDGRLTPLAHCEDCGHDFTEYRREGHHEDYNKPLEVRWLCALCHGKRHRADV